MAELRQVGSKAELRRVSWRSRAKVLLALRESIPFGGGKQVFEGTGSEVTVVFA